MKLTNSKKLNIRLNTWLKKTVFVLFTVVSVLVLIYPFYPEPYSELYYEAYSFFNEQVNSASEQKHYVIAQTPNYVLVGTEAEELARLRSGVSGIGGLQDINWDTCLLYTSPSPRD